MSRQFFEWSAHSAYEARTLLRNLREIHPSPPGCLKACDAECVTG